MIYIVIGLVITVLVIVISSVKASDKSEQKIFICIENHDYSHTFDDVHSAILVNDNLIITLRNGDKCKLNISDYENIYIY